VNDGYCGGGVAAGVTDGLALGVHGAPTVFLSGS